MLLISVIKYLIVMPDVKDLAQAAQGAAAAPESVNVVEPTTSVNQPVQPTVDTDNQNSTQVETIDDVVRRICTDGHSYVMTTVITNIDCQNVQVVMASLISMRLLLLLVLSKVLKVCLMVHIEWVCLVLFRCHSIRYCL